LTFPSQPVMEWPKQKILGKYGKPHVTIVTPTPEDVFGTPLPPRQPGSGGNSGYVFVPLGDGGVEVHSPPTIEWPESQPRPPSPQHSGETHNEAMYSKTCEIRTPFIKTSQKWPYFRSVLISEGSGAICTEKTPFMYLMFPVGRIYVLSMHGKGNGKLVFGTNGFFFSLFHLMSILHSVLFHRFYCILVY
jgi:hypothetical protein